MALIAVLSAAMTSTAAADPTYTVMNAAGGIYWRSAPDWNAVEAISGFGVYNGTTIAVHCYQSGTSVPGSADTMWEQATDVAGPGYGSGWLNEHFINDGQPINQPSPGVPTCNAPPPPSPPSPPPPSPPGLVFTVFNAEGGIYYRNSPHWSDTSATPGVGVYNGDQVQLICGALGDPVGPYNDTAWSYVNNLSRPVGEGWVNEHFINDGALSNQFVAGEPMCGADIPGTATGSNSGGSGSSSQGGSTGSSSPASPPTGSGCPAYMLFDSRGSGEPSGAPSPPGAFFASELRHRHPSSRLAIVDNPYPAVGLWGSVAQLLNLVGAATGIGPLGAYHGSVVDGERWLQDNLVQETTACPSTKLLLTGYSQGAQVTGDVVQRHVSSATKRHIVGVALFGDPYFNSADASDRGGYEHGRNGILGVRHGYSHSSHVLSYCHKHDPICQAPRNIVEAIAYRLTNHNNYQYDGAAAARAF